MIVPLSPFLNKTKDKIRIRIVYEVNKCLETKKWCLLEKKDTNRKKYKMKKMKKWWLENKKRDK